MLPPSASERSPLWYGGRLRERGWFCAGHVMVQVCDVVKVADPIGLKYVASARVDGQQKKLTCAHTLPSVTATLVGSAGSSSRAVGTSFSFFFFVFRLNGAKITAVITGITSFKSKMSSSFS